MICEIVVLQQGDLQFCQIICGQNAVDIAAQQAIEFSLGILCTPRLASCKPMQLCKTVRIRCSITETAVVDIWNRPAISGIAELSP